MSRDGSGKKLSTIANTQEFVRLFGDEARSWGIPSSRFLSVLFTMWNQLDEPAKEAAIMADLRRCRGPIPGQVAAPGPVAAKH